MEIEARSPHIGNLMNESFRKKTLIEQLRFYRMARKSPSAGALAGNMLEFIAHRVLTTKEDKYKFKYLDPDNKVILQIILKLIFF